MNAAVMAERHRSTNRLSDKALAWFTLAGVVGYVAIDVLLKFLRPGYSLLYNAESDYGRGPWYWVMDLNFLLRCALSLAVAAALAHIVRPGSADAAAASDPAQEGRAGSGSGRAGVILVVIWAVCSGLLAFFADNIEGQRVHGSGAVHLLLAFIAFPCVAVGTILISASLRSHPAWRIAKTILLPISIAGACAFLLLGSAVGHKQAPGGLYERIFLGLELLWMAVAAWHIAMRAAAEQPG
jgi:Protein of unknown function (DUF998)